MEINDNKLVIDFSMLMDLRIDFSFKQLFGSANTMFLISLLNAVFANKNIPRKIESLAIMNPHLEKYSKDDKLSILDIRAKLDDGTTILIEMHLYDIDDLKYKTIRSWARTFGEELNEGENYSAQPPVVCVSFVNGSLDGEQKIHKCCKILDIDDHTVFSDALELHYIDMKAFVKSINEKGGIEKSEKTMLANWLAIITEKEIKDKTIIENICKEQEEINMAVSTLARMSEDKIIRQAYLKRQDEIMIYNRNMKDLDEYKRKAEQEQRRAEQEQHRAEIAEAEIEKLRSRIAELES